MPIKITKKKNAIRIIKESVIYAIIVEQKTRIFVVIDFGFIFSCMTIRKPGRMEMSVNPMIPERTVFIEVNIASIRNVTGTEVNSAIKNIKIILFIILSFYENRRT